MNELQKAFSEICNVPLPRQEKALRLPPSAKKAFDEYCLTFRQKFLTVPKLIDYSHETKLLRISTLSAAVSFKRLKQLTRMMK